MEAVEAFKPLRNQFGAVTPTGQVTQNDILFTAYYLFCVLDDRGLPPDDEFRRLVETARQYINEDGSTLRSPGSAELDSHDNLTGWAVLSSFLYPVWSQKILAYGRANEWIWPGTEPVEQRYLGRHAAVIPILQLAAGERPDIMGSLVYAGNAALSAFASSSNQDAYSLNYAMSRVVLSSGSRAPTLMLLGAFFWKLVQALRGRTMAQNLTDYGWGGTPYVTYIK